MKRKKEYKLTPAQILLAVHLAELKIATLPEFTFSPLRRFRFDLANKMRQIGFEISGGEFSGGHRRGKAIRSDYEKLNLAQAFGWRVFTFTNQQVLTGEAQEFVRRYIAPEFS